MGKFKGSMHVLPMHLVIRYGVVFAYVLATIQLLTELLDLLKLSDLYVCRIIGTSGVEIRE